MKSINYVRLPSGWTRTESTEDIQDVIEKLWVGSHLEGPFDFAKGERIYGELSVAGIVRINDGRIVRGLQSPDGQVVFILRVSDPSSGTYALFHFASDGDKWWRMVDQPTCLSIGDQASVKAAVAEWMRTH